jgi:hypothetical protein
MPQENNSLNLSKHFNHQVYKMVDMFMKTCPTLNPFHVKDTMAHDYHVYDPSSKLMVLCKMQMEILPILSQQLKNYNM